VIKFATLDPLGMGVEMDGGKPGWNDAMNGLPGLLGSGTPETFELLRLLRFLRVCNISRDGFANRSADISIAIGPGLGRQFVDTFYSSSRLECAGSVGVLELQLFCSIFNSRILDSSTFDVRLTPDYVPADRACATSVSSFNSTFVFGSVLPAGPSFLAPLFKSLSSRVQRTPRFMTALTTGGSEGVPRTQHPRLLGTPRPDRGRQRRAQDLQRQRGR